jgi:ferredoxin
LNEIVHVFLFYFVVETEIEHEIQIDRPTGIRNEKRDRLKSDVHEVKLCLLMIFRLHNQLITISESDYLHRIEQIKIRYLHSQSVDWYTTICGKCNDNCHEKCTLNETDDTFGCEIIQRDDGLCNHCTQLCGYSEHYHDKKRIQLVSKSMKEVMFDISLDAPNDNINDGYSILTQAMKNHLNTLKAKIVNFVNEENNMDIVNEILFTLQQLMTETYPLQDSKEKITYQRLIGQFQLFLQQRSYISQPM